MDALGATDLASFGGSEVPGQASAGAEFVGEPVEDDLGALHPVHR